MCTHTCVGAAGTCTRHGQKPLALSLPLPLPRTGGHAPFSAGHSLAQQVGAVTHWRWVLQGPQSACSRSDAPCFVHCSLLADGVEADHRPRWAGPAAESRPLCPGAQSEPAPSRRLLVFARAGALGSSPDASSLPWDVRQYPDLWAPAGRRTPLWTDQGGVRTCCHFVAERWQHVPSARWKGTVRASVPGTTRS